MLSSNWHLIVFTVIKNILPELQGLLMYLLRLGLQAFLAHFWHVIGTFLAYCWHSIGTFLAKLWHVFGTCSQGTRSGQADMDQHSTVGHLHLK